MDSKRLILAMLLAFAVIFGWRIFVDQMYERHPEWRRPGPEAVAPPPAPTTTAPTTETVATTQAPREAPSATQTATPAPLRIVSPATQPDIITLGGDDAAYNMIVRVSSSAASLESVTLKKYRDPEGKDDYIFQTPFDPARPETRALATRYVKVNGGQPLDIAGAAWTTESQSESSAVFTLDLGQLRLRKIYELADAASPGKGYELSVRHEVINPGGEPVNVELGWTGTLTPPRETTRGMDLQVIAGYDQGQGYDQVALRHHVIEEYSATKTEFDLTKGENNEPLLWAGTLSVYFDAMLRPEPIETGAASPAYIAKAIAYAINPDAQPHERQAAVRFETQALSVPAQGTLALPSRAYLGPRWRNILNENHYASFPLSYDQTLVLTSGWCGICTWQWLINGLVWLLNIFHWVFGGFAGHGDWGLAIIALVVLVRVLLHPITKKSQVSMMRMGKLGPEIERLKNKHKDDKDALNREMMQLYKDQGIGMYLGCLPMFLQMPIWIALWSALQSTFELRQAPFLWGWTWIDDLARPDRLVEFHGVFIPSWIPLLGGTQITGLNLLPILLGLVFYVQMKFTPQPPATTPEQEMQRKMMVWMSVLLFPLFLYNGPSGLNLYILTSTTIGIIESKRIRDHIKQREEEEKAGKVIVDAPKSMKKRRDEDDGRGIRKGKQPPPPQGGLAGWFAKIKAQAAEIQRQADKGRK